MNGGERAIGEGSSACGCIGQWQGILCDVNHGSHSPSKMWFRALHLETTACSQEHGAEERKRNAPPHSTRTDDEGG